MIKRLRKCCSMGFWNKRDKKDTKRSAVPQQHYDVINDRDDVYAFVIKILDSLGCKQLMNNVGHQLNDTVFVILRNNDDEFFVKIVKKDELIEKMSFFNETEWNDCYIISHKNLDFSNGKDLIFQNQLMNVLKKTGHVTNFGVTPVEVNAESVLTVDERAGYENFWQTVLEILYSPRAKTVGWSMFWDKDRITNQKLFDKTSRNIEDKETILSEIIAWDSAEDIMNYTLEDELGNVFSSNVLAEVIAEWLRKMFQISPYKEKIAELVAATSRRKTNDLVHDFFVLGKNTLYIGTDSRYRDFSFNVVKQRSVHSYPVGSGGYTRHNFNDTYLTNKELKKRLLVLSATFGLRINLKEEVVASFPEYDENFTEKIQKENAEKVKAFSEIVEILEKENAKNDSYFDNAINLAERKREREASETVMGALLNTDVACEDQHIDDVPTMKPVAEDLTKVLTRSGEEFDGVVDELKSFKVNDTSVSGVFKR